MPSFQQDLSDRLLQDEQQHLTRHLQTLPGGMVSFADNDYLGLSRHPRVLASAIRSLESSHRAGSAASRLISGHQPEHGELEQQLAAFKKTEACLVFPSGYAAATGTIPALVDRHDYVVFDKLCHACLIDGAKLSEASPAVFAHNDSAQLESILREIRAHDSSARILVVVESVYSMDGDTAPLVEICRLKNAFDAWLLVDEAHATGIYGPNGRGLCHELAVAGQIDVQMGTLGKALGVSGGYIAGSTQLKQLLLQRARSFIFTTATPPALAAALSASLEIVNSSEGDELRNKLWQNVQSLHSLTSGRTNLLSPISPVILGDENRTLAVSNQLLESGFYVPAIRHPSVARDKARLRITLSSSHTPDQIASLARHLEPCFRETD